MSETAKEMALNRVSVYKHKVSGSMYENLAHNHGKQCALIETEHLISVLNGLWANIALQGVSCEETKAMIDKTMEVKTEIEKL